MDECDCVVPRDKVADFILYTHRLAKDLDIRIPASGMPATEYARLCLPRRPRGKGLQEN